MINSMMKIYRIRESRASRAERTDRGIGKVSSPMVTALMTIRARIAFWKRELSDRS
jgi:hypothetical protein